MILINRRIKCIPHLYTRFRSKLKTFTEPFSVGLSSFSVVVLIHLWLITSLSFDGESEYPSIMKMSGEAHQFSAVVVMGPRRGDVRCTDADRSDSILSINFSFNLFRKRARKDIWASARNCSAPDPLSIAMITNTTEKFV